jgi:hypothetical protein
VVLIYYVPPAKHVVAFQKSSSPELDTLLDTIRTKIILPSYLPYERRKMLYDVRYEKKLRNDPITMEIDGEVLAFYHTDRFTLPNTVKSVNEVLRQMQTHWDWENLPMLLEGVCKHAKRKLPPYMYTKMTRLAGMNGRIDIIIRCARQIKHTGFSLGRSPETVNEILGWIQKPAIDSNWDVEATEKALEWTEKLIDLLEDPSHRPPVSNDHTSMLAFPIFRDPLVLGTRLHMAAALALKHRGGEDVDGKVAKYATDIVSVWPAQQGLFELHGPDVYAPGGLLGYLRPPNTQLYFGSPVWSGLEMAAKVVNPLLADQLRQRSALVRRELDAAMAAPERKPGRRGEDMYNTLVEGQN